jgi:hypothetical protein
LTLGAVPMATVLAAGLLISHQSLVSRPFVLGFEAFGALALVVYVVLATGFPEETIGPYLGLLIDPLVRRLGRNRHLFGPVAFPAITAMLGLPQLALALIGGSLYRRHRPTIPGRSVPTFR